MAKRKRGRLSTREISSRRIIQRGCPLIVTNTAKSIQKPRILKTTMKGLQDAKKNKKGTDQRRIKFKQDKRVIEAQDNNSSSEKIDSN